MAGNYLIAGVVGIVFAVGVAIYEVFKESRRERQYDYYGHNRKEYPHRDPSPQPEKRGIVCKVCNYKIDIHNKGQWTTLPCTHAFHNACILGESVCPAIGCKERIIRSRPVQKQAVCGSCRRPLAKEDIDRLSCGHIFHSHCIIGKNYCPFCQKLIETPRSTATSPLPEVKCDSCNTQVGSNELAKLNCDHEVHKDCLKMGFCPMPRCTYLRSMKEHRW